MTSCGWHAWPARNSRANLSRPARLPLVADQVSSAVTLAAMARQGPLPASMDQQPPAQIRSATNVLRHLASISDFNILFAAKAP